MKEHFNLLVLGGGSGGLAAAQKAASYGAKVALVESGRLGGTCVNVGCIPKKIMWYAAQFPEFYELAASYGFHCGEPSFNFKKLVHHREQYIRKLNEIYEQRLIKNKIQYVQGKASFSGKNTVIVNHTTYSADHIVIATGCQPRHPSIPGAELGIDSDGFFALHEQPKHVAIVGAGYIALEIAGMLNQLGSKVKLFIRYEKFLRQYDNLLSDTLMDVMIAQGIEILPFHNPEKITRNAQDKLTIHCHDKKPVTNFDVVLFAIGRYPLLQDLNLASVGVQTDKHGFILTDKWEVTNVPHIYAVGDVTGKKLLTPVAVAAGRRLSARLFGGEKDAHLDYENIPTVIFSHPPIGSVGLSEEEAMKQYGRDQLSIWQTQFNPIFYALSQHKTPTHMKLVTLKESEKIIGCHIIGLNADEILQGFAVAIKMGATKKDFNDTVAIHPTSAEELVLF